MMVQVISNYEVLGEEKVKVAKARALSINPNGCFTVHSVFLNKENLKEFPDYIQFGVVKSYFSCYRNQLTSLRGCPREVREYFDCSYNNLTSLEGAPREVGGLFDCSKNNIQFTEEDVRKVCKVGGKITV